MHALFGSGDKGKHCNLYYSILKDKVTDLYNTPLKVHNSLHKEDQEIRVLNLFSFGDYPACCDLTCHSLRGVCDFLWLTFLFDLAYTGVWLLQVQDERHSFEGIENSGVLGQWVLVEGW